MFKCTCTLNCIFGNIMFHWKQLGYMERALQICGIFALNFWVHNCWSPPAPCARLGRGSRSPSCTKPQSGKLPHETRQRQQGCSSLWSCSSTKGQLLLSSSSIWQIFEVGETVKGDFAKGENHLGSFARSCTQCATVCIGEFRLTTVAL